MSSPKRVLRTGLIALALLGATALAGCSGLTPVYGERGIGAERIALRYAAPTSRLEQIIYQDVALRLGREGTAQNPLLTVTTSTSERQLTMSGVNRPAQQREAKVTAKIELKDAAGQVLLVTERSATALYTEDSQALASAAAETDAYERAARALAETIRLTLIGTLAKTAG